MPKDIQQGCGHLCEVMPQVFRGLGFGFGAEHPREARWCIEFWQ